MSQWTFLTNHAHVLACLAEDPTTRLRDVADRVGITERAAQRIVTELADAGYLEIDKEGRRNHYTLRERVPLRHPIEAHVNVGALLALIRSRDD